jgi:ABC-2 type transport system permease protein
MTFLAIARMAFFQQAFYRFELLFNALRAVVFVVVIAAVWRAVYAARPSLAGLTFEQVVFYTCTAAMLTLLYEVNVEREIGDRLRSGNLAMQLLKPVNYFLYGFAEGCGTLAYTALFSVLPTFLVLALILDLPGLTPGSLALAILMVAQGFVLFFAFCHITALTTFFTVEVWGVEYMRIVLVRFLAGGLVPLTLFPEALHRIALWLPFPYMVYYPTLAITGQLAPELVPRALLIQVAWGGALLALNSVYWKLIVRRVTIHGG